MSEQQPDRHDDEAWLLARERGESGPAISEAGAARYARLGALIAELPAAPAGIAQRTDWQRQVLATIDAELDAERAAGNAREQPITRRRRWPTAMIAAAASLVIVVGILASRRLWRGHVPVVPGDYVVDVTVESRGSTGHGSGPDRGTDAAVGDQLVIRGAAPQDAELRVYDDAGVELARCASPGPDCSIERSGPQTVVRLTLAPRVRGVLRPVLFAPPTHQTSSGYDSDVAAAEAAGTQVIVHAPVHVR